MCWASEVEESEDGGKIWVAHPGTLAMIMTTSPCLST